MIKAIILSSVFTLPVVTDWETVEDNGFLFSSRRLGSELITMQVPCTEFTDVTKKSTDLVHKKKLTVDLSRLMKEYCNGCRCIIPIMEWSDIGMKCIKKCDGNPVYSYSKTECVCSRHDSLKYVCSKDIYMKKSVVHCSMDYVVNAVGN